MTIHKDRQTALEEGLEQVRDAVAAEGVGATVFACQGPPVCDRTFGDDDDVAELTKDCPWCQRIRVEVDGTETVTEPHRA